MTNQTRLNFTEEITDLFDRQYVFRVQDLAES